MYSISPYKLFILTSSLPHFCDYHNFLPSLKKKKNTHDLYGALFGFHFGTYLLFFFFFIKLGLLEVFELSYSHNGVISYYVIHEHRDVVSSFVQMDARVQLGRNLASLNSPVLLRTCFRLFFQHLYPPPPCYCILMMLF